MRNSIFKSYTKKILRSEAFVSVMIVFVLALGIIGTSYALYMDVDTDTNYQLVEVGDLSIGFDNGENTITLENMTPMEDEIAVKETGNIFSFYIYNTGTYTTDYEIKLVPDNANGNTIAPEFINYQICKDNAENCTEIKTLGENSLIYTDALSPKRETDASNPSAYYFLRLWINNQYTETTGGTIKYNVEISAKNASGYLDNDNTLAGAILNNPNITINNTVPIFDGIADYKITGDATSGELGLFKAEDDYGTSYYFRGAQSNNYVNFAGMCWRIVRIEGDGSIKLILEDYDQLCDSEDINGVLNMNGNWNDGKTYDYGYSSNKPDLINNTQTNVNLILSFSTFQRTLAMKINVMLTDDVTQTEINDVLASKLKSEEWCYDIKESFIDQNNYIYYEPYIRINTKQIPTLKCNGTKINKFKDNTNMYVGTLTADEIFFAGAYSSPNYNYYLMNNYAKDKRTWWSLSPSHTDKYNGYAFLPDVDGKLYSIYTGNARYSRPSIVLKSNSIIVNGKGTIENPYNISN